MSQTKTSFQITKERFMRLGLVTVKNPFVYVLAACFLVTYIAPGTTPIVILGKDATTWTNWFLSLTSLWWAVNFVIFMTRNDRYAKSNQLVVVRGKTVAEEEEGNRRDVWLYVGATITLLAIGLVQQLVAGGANIVVLLFLLLLQLAPLAGGTSLQEQAMHEGKYVSTFFLIVLIAFVLIFGPRPFQKSVAAAGDKPIPQNASAVQPTATPPAQKPDATPRVIVPTVVLNAPTPQPQSKCPAGTVPMKGQPTWVEDLAGSGKFTPLVVNNGKTPIYTLGTESLTGEVKIAADGAVYCKLKIVSYWWRK